jgi:hypothetical protein
MKLVDCRLNERNETVEHHSKTRLRFPRVECAQLSDQHWELELIEERIAVRVNETEAARSWVLAGQQTSGV